MASKLQFTDPIGEMLPPPHGLGFWVDRVIRIEAAGVESDMEKRLKMRAGLRVAQAAARARRALAALQELERAK